MKSVAFPGFDLYSFKAHNWLVPCVSGLSYIPFVLTHRKREQVYTENINLWLCSLYALTFRQFIH